MNINMSEIEDEIIGAVKDRAFSFDTANCLLAFIEKAISISKEIEGVENDKTKTFLRLAFYNLVKKVFDMYGL